MTNLKEHDIETFSNALEGVESLQVNTALLEYYTSMTEHHRNKISMLGGAYLVLSQLMLITPQEIIASAIKNDSLLFSAVLGLIMSLLFLGLLHHAANISVIATQRLNVLRNIYWAKLPKNEITDDYQIWKNSFEFKHRDITSVSRLSMLYATPILMSIFILTIMRYHSIVDTILPPGREIYIVLGMFYAAQAALFLPYLKIITLRAYNFYQTRDTYKIVQNAKSRTECLRSLKV